MNDLSYKDLFSLTLLTLRAVNCGVLWNAQWQCPHISGTKG